MVLHQQGTENTDCVWFAPRIWALMHQHRAKEWSPKVSCPTRQGGEKQREIFADVGQGCRRAKIPSGSWCRKLRAKP